MARTLTTPITTDWDYQVEKVKCYDPEGDWTGDWMTRRVDRKGPKKGTLKVGVSKDYNVVQNRDIVEPVQEVLAQLGLEPTNVKHYVFKNGARYKARYEFKDTQIELPKVGDAMGFRLDLDNSFDLWHRIKTMGGGLRLVCTNGMTAFDKAHGISCKHSNKFNIDSIKRAIGGALEGFYNLAKDDNPYTVMASRRVTQEQGIHILQNLANKGDISELRREAITKVWNDPTHREDEDRNLYNLLNAVTEYTTHELAESNFSMSENINTKVTNRLVLASKDESLLNALWTPEKSEAVKSETVAANENALITE